ncbi:hypothetical protein AAV35_006455 [Salimicrobium jeotgali]|uniref:Uncharacterized protein n=1 Tax=Salimicrobium jeotgali TaxID=1230341 RepID=K2GEN9_9BACI|nr:hypothetical protein [Salimicrobium jeotgali]AKG04462.1 hypothetical protein AAV35_006455 [Salimicrobium jeotgali]EKE32667.1 hypothetical protein MJ3_01877 [Salimicrobium jeotgali]MBM7695347.1 hypothetical protein [Salimicrobium jeotgali]
MKEKFPYIVYWFLFLLGLHSYWQFFFVDYGVIYTVFFTFISGLFGGMVALVLRNYKLVMLSFLLLISPYIIILGMHYV